VLHIYNRGNNKKNIFLADTDFRVFESLIQHFKQKYRISLYFYVLMSNHFHLIIEQHNNGAAILFIRDLQVGYARYFNARYMTQGHVWQSRYRSKSIDKDNYLLACGLYVEDNPIRAGIVRTADEYEWSSSWRRKSAQYNNIIDRCPYLTS